MAVNISAGILCCIGTFFFIVGTTGLLRLPDVFSRLHSSTKCDTLGAGSIIAAIAVCSGWSWDLLKLLAIAAFLLLSSATCGHAIGLSALKQGFKPWMRQNGGG